jgi:NADH-quinone oxidoreductase subunit N
VYALLLFSALGAVVLAAAADLMELILGVLLSSATSYVLAAWHRASPRSAEAGIKYYLLSALTNGAMLYGAVLLFGLAGSTTFLALRDHLIGADALGLVVAFVLLSLGLALKLGAVPVHAWMPDVADGAPAPMAAFATTAPKVGALIALGRLVLVLPNQQTGWRVLVAVLAATTMTLGNLAALWQDDIRRLLGWSAVSQSGYGLLAVVALGKSSLALPSLLYFLVAYSLANLAAFGVVIELRGRTDRGDYTGLAAGHPVLAASLLVAFLSFVGIPPLAGFTAKLALFGAAIDAGYTWLAVLAVANSVLSLAYYLRVLAPAYLDLRDAPLPVLAQSAAAATLISALAVVVVGVVVQPLLHAFNTARLLPG